MKIINTGIIATSLALGLLVLTPERSQAQPKALTIALTATYQGQDVISGPDQNIDKSTTSSVKFTSASMLTLIAANLGFNDKGYSLICDPLNGYDIGATNKANGGDFQDASSFFTIDTSGGGVTSGSTDSDTGKESETATVYTVVTFDDGNGNAFTVNGLFKITSSTPAPTAAQLNNGVTPNTTLTFSGTVSGVGTVVDKQGNTDPAVFTGTISGGGVGANND